MNWRWIQSKPFLILGATLADDARSKKYRSPPSRAPGKIIWSRHTSADARFFFFQFFCVCLASLYYLPKVTYDKDSIVPVSLCEAAFPTSICNSFSSLFFLENYSTMIGGALLPSVCCMSDPIFSTLK